MTGQAPQTFLPLIVEPDELQQHLGDTNLLVLELCKPGVYAQYHIPGAVHLDYSQIVAKRGMTGGLLPDMLQLSTLFSSVGLTPHTHVVAYDDEGGGKAARLLWTLDVIGHKYFSLLNGGLQAWYSEQHPGSNEPAHPQASHYPIVEARQGIADAEYILAHLQDANTCILDARSANEYLGLTQTAQRNGHIPGAVNIEWASFMDTQRNLRLKPREEILQALEARGITPDKEVIVHCQTHHRSAHTYIVLKSLGYTKVKGYAGSWSDWGNRPDTPVETGSGTL